MFNNTRFNGYLNVRSQLHKVPISNKIIIMKIVMKQKADRFRTLVK